MIEVLYEDKDLLVIFKPYGLSSGDLTERIKEEKGIDVFLVHRLDQVVSGIMLLAKNSKSAALLTEEINNDSFNKEYLALVKGDIQEAGILEGYIYHDRNRNRSYMVKREMALNMLSLRISLLLEKRIFLLSWLSFLQVVHIRLDVNSRLWVVHFLGMASMVVRLMVRSNYLVFI